MSRPTIHDPEILDLVAEKLVDCVTLESDDEREDVKEQLREALSACLSTDGYVLGKYLDQYMGWEVDSELVDELSEADHITHKVHQDFIRKWIEDNNINPRFRVGDTVSVVRKQDRAVGEIISIDHQRGKYTIFVEAFGHVRKGNGSHGIIMDWEVIEKLNADKDTSHPD